MKVAVNITPLLTEHKYRGVGKYTQHLIDSLEKNNDIQIIKFTDINEIEEVDLVHYPWFDLFFHTLPILKKKPTVVTVHDVMPLIFSEQYPPGIKGKINLFLQNIALKNCARVITDSYCSKKDIVKHLGIDGKKIEVVHLAADALSSKNLTKLAEIAEVSEKYKLESPFILYVGDVNYVKNLPLLIEGFSKMIKQPENEKLKLVLIGKAFLQKINSNHPELASLDKVNKLIISLGLEDNILRVGGVDEGELSAFYKLASVYVQPSFYEGFGLPVLEALTYGIPVLSSEGGSLSEVGGDAVLYFDPYNMEDFISKLEKLIKDVNLRKEMSKKGLKQALKFSWNNVAKETMRVYENVLLSE